MIDVVAAARPRCSRRHRSSASVEKSTVTSVASVSDHPSRDLTPSVPLAVETHHLADARKRGLAIEPSPWIVSSPS